MTTTALFLLNSGTEVFVHQIIVQNNSVISLAVLYLLGTDLLICF